MCKKISVSFEDDLNLSVVSERLVGDVVVASAVTAVVAPFLTVVDQALVQRASGSHTIVGSALTSMSSMVRQPIAYIKSPTFLWMWATYAATYSAANSLRTITEYQEFKAVKAVTTADQQVRVQQQQQQRTTATLFVGTTVVNSSASMIKDRAYARMFGAAASATVPRISYALWMSRDLTVIGSSFILPDHVSKLLTSHGMEEARATSVAQIGTPVAAQLIAAPLHFLGLDCYNRSLTGNWTSRFMERSRFLLQGYPEVVDQERCLSS